MPQIPRYKELGVPQNTSIAIPGIPAGPNIPEAAFGGEVARSMGAAALSVAHAADISLRVREADRHNDVAKARVNAFRKFEEYEAGLEGRTDYKEYEKEFGRLAEAIRKETRETLKDERAYEDWLPDFEFMTIRGARQVRSVAARQRVDAGRAQLDEALDVLSKSIDQTYAGASAEDLVQGYVKHGYITAEDGQKRLAAYRHRRDMTEALQDIRFGRFDREKYPNLDELELDRLQDASDLETKRKEAQAIEDEKALLENIREKWRLQAQPKLLQGRLTVDDVFGSPLDAQGREHWFGLIEKQANANKKKDEKSPLELTDPAVEARIMYRVYDEKGPSITATQILDQVGAGLSVADGDKWVGRLRAIDKKEDPAKTKIYQRSIKMFDDALRAEVIDRPAWVRLQGEFDRIVQDNPDMDEDRMMDLATRLIAPEKQGFLSRKVSEARDWLTGRERFRETGKIVPPWNDTSRPLRERAVAHLRREGRIVTEQTIDQVIEMLREEDARAGK